MTSPGDIVLFNYPGAQETKPRPVVVVSTDTYHSTRPDMILGLLTTKLASATGPTDYILQDWAAAGLASPSAFRTFLATLPARGMIQKIDPFPITIGMKSRRDCASRWL